MNEFLSHEGRKRRRKKNEKETNVRKSFFERQTWWYVNSYVLPPFRLDVLPPLSSRYITFLAKSRVFFLSFDQISATQIQLMDDGKQRKYLCYGKSLKELVNKKNPSVTALNFLFDFLFSFRSTKLYDNQTLNTKCGQSFPKRTMTITI